MQSKINQSKHTDLGEIIKDKQSKGKKEDGMGGKYRCFPVSAMVALLSAVQNVLLCADNVQVLTTVLQGLRNTFYSSLNPS